MTKQLVMENKMLTPERLEIRTNEVPVPEAIPAKPKEGAEAPTKANRSKKARSADK